MRHFHGESASEVQDIAFNLMAVKLYSLATIIILYYDILITLGDEINQIWRRKLSPFTILWLLNRYVPPIFFIFVLLAFHDPRWTANDTICNKAIYIPAVLGIASSTVIGVIFSGRIYATYMLNKAVLIPILSLLVVVQAVKIWALTAGERLRLPPGLVGCILTSGPDSLKFTFIWLAELPFDAVVLLFTMYRAISMNRVSGGGLHSLLYLIARDGVIYFVVVCIVDVVNVLTFLLAPADLQAINASLTVSINPLIVSRLILNLKIANNKPPAPALKIPIKQQVTTHRSAPSDLPGATC